MRALIFVLCLLLSLLNLIAGTAALVFRHTFATFNPLQIATDFLFQIVWGLPLAAALFILLLVLGILSNTRAHAALLALVLNVVALGFVLSVFGPPHDWDQAIFFLPVLLALAGFGWLASPIWRRSVSAPA